jgi:hypothetical protein
VVNDFRHTLQMKLPLLSIICLDVSISGVRVIHVEADGFKPAKFKSR